MVIGGETCVYVHVCIHLIYMYIHVTTCFIKYPRGLLQLIQREGELKDFPEKETFQTSFDKPVGFPWCLPSILQNKTSPWRWAKDLKSHGRLQFEPGTPTHPYIHIPKAYALKAQSSKKLSCYWGKKLGETQDSGPSFSIQPWNGWICSATCSCLSPSNGSDRNLQNHEPK